MGFRLFKRKESEADREWYDRRDRLQKESSQASREIVEEVKNVDPSLGSSMSFLMTQQVILEEHGFDVPENPNARLALQRYVNEYRKIASGDPDGLRSAIVQGAFYPIKAYAIRQNKRNGTNYPTEIDRVIR